MKTVKTIVVFITSCICMLLITQDIKSQDKAAALRETTPEQWAKMQTMMMKNKLQLDSAQTQTVQAINLKYAQKMEPVLLSDEGKFKRLRTMMAIQKAKDTDLKVVLTKDQQKQYEAMKDEMTEKLKDTRKEKP